MTFISYAQNYEDVMLRRALKDVDKGFYIDVGANDPVVDSVTKAFYDAGWRGINIEPVSEWFEKLQQDRPDDTNLQLAVGARKGKINFYEVSGTGLSTSNKSIAKQHAQEQGFESKRKKVPVVRLTTICEQYSHSDIHFLKIDVEGAEKSVLQGFDLKKFRPWIIMVESTLPGTQIEKHEGWEPILLAADYEYIKFDGLNRIYVAKEHKKITNSLIAPPNVFDGFVLSGTGSSSFHVGIAQIRASLQETKQQRQQLEKQVQSLQVEAGQHDEKLREKETKQQELLLSMVEKETRLQEAATTLTNNKKEIDKLQASLADRTAQQQVLETTLQETKQQRQQLETQLQTVQAEAGHLSEQLHMNGESINWLNNEWDAAKQQIDELHQSNHQWWSMADQQSKELEESRTKIDELNQSCHHFWLEADRITKELQGVYSSKSWRMTFPLRKLMQLVKWLFRLPSRLAFWIIRLPKRAARWLLVKSMAYALKHPGLKVRAMVWLRNYPNLEAKLRRLALARGLFPAQAASTIIPTQPVPESVESPPIPSQPVTESPEPGLDITVNEVTNLASDLSHLTPSARRIYGELKTAMAQYEQGSR